MNKAGTTASIALICLSLINFIMATSIYVFVYGTLKKFQPNYHRLLNASLGKADFIGRYRTTKTWPLLIVTRANLPCLLPLENEGYRVDGEVFRVDNKMLSFLDDFEGHPEQYIRREISVEPMDPSDDQSSTIVCWCYFYNAEMSSLAESDRVNVTFLSSYRSEGDHGRPYIYEADDERLTF